jgi:hypothetical protein
MINGVGHLRSLRIYPRQRSGDALRRLTMGGSPRRSASAVAWWKLSAMRAVALAMTEVARGSSEAMPSYPRPTIAGYARVPLRPPMLWPSPMRLIAPFAVALSKAEQRGTIAHSFPAHQRGQWRARRHGIAGIDGNVGTLESVSYRNERT